MGYFSGSHWCTRLMCFWGGRGLALSLGASHYCLPCLKRMRDTMINGGVVAKEANRFSFGVFAFVHVLAAAAAAWRGGAPFAGLKCFFLLDSFTYQLGSSCVSLQKDV